MTPTMEAHCIAHTEEFGFGPCGSFAALLRRRGIGRIAVCDYVMPGKEFGFGHFVVIDADDNIIDLVNPFVGEGEYVDLEIISDDEMPDLVTETEITFWDKRVDRGSEVS